MAGIYIHIPFCKQACHYCNFHFSTTFESYRIPLINSLQKEIVQRKDFFATTADGIGSVYFGGGTPSLLQPKELYELISVIWNTFNIQADAEITLEANPDDLSEEYLSFLRDTPVNRLSIGIQSFDENDLKYLHRVHNRKQAIQSLKQAAMMGFTAVSADLIFGIPTSSVNRLEHDVRIFADLGVEHISAYGLTVEPKTALEKMIQLKKTISADDAQVAAEMEWLMDYLPSLGYHQYEISNYSIPGAEARHNSSYWEGKPYLGIGPSAHSYKAPVRSWNLSNNISYIKGISAGEQISSSESLTTADTYNEYVMTALRTSKGVDLLNLQAQYGEAYLTHFSNQIRQFIADEMAFLLDNKIVLSKKGKLFCDQISQSLFYIP